MHITIDLDWNKFKFGDDNQFAKNSQIAIHVIIHEARNSYVSLYR